MEPSLLRNAALCRAESLLLAEILTAPGRMKRLNAASAQNRPEVVYESP
jgi:hypothetical protein